MTGGAPDVDLSRARTEGLRLRRADRTDDAGMRAVNGDAFPTNPKTRADVTAWQWWDDPFGEPVAWVWEDEASGRIVGQYLAYPLPAVLDGEPGRIAIGVDLAVASDHQGRGLAQPLFDVTVRDAVAAVGPFYSYPNEQSVRGAARAGLVGVARLRVRVLPLRAGSLVDDLPGPRPLGRLALGVGSRVLGLRLRAPADVVVEVAEAVGVDDVPEELDALWDRLVPRAPWGVARHADWWRWRYAGHPDRPYALLTARRAGRLVGAAVVLERDDLGGRFACLLELLVDDAAAARALVAAVRERAGDDLDGIAATGVPGSIVDRAGADAGLVAVPARLLSRPIHFFVSPHPRVGSDPAARSWTTAWGDLDHI